MLFYLYTKYAALQTCPYTVPEMELSKKTKHQRLNLDDEVSYSFSCAFLRQSQYKSESQYRLSQLNSFYLAEWVGQRGTLYSNFIVLRFFFSIFHSFFFWMFL